MALNWVDYQGSNSMQVSCYDKHITLSNGFYNLVFEPDSIRPNSVVGLLDIPPGFHFDSDSSQSSSGLFAEFAWGVYTLSFFYQASSRGFSCISSHPIFTPKSQIEINGSFGEIKYLFGDFRVNINGALITGNNNLSSSSASEISFSVSIWGTSMGTSSAYNSTANLTLPLHS